MINIEVQEQLEISFLTCFPQRDLRGCYDKKKKI